ncbi:MAG: DUF6311 domain-containing protein [Ilumatobacteraceae bacterium]
MTSRDLRTAIEQYFAQMYAFVVGTVVFIYATGGRIIDPTNRDWLMLGDSAQHYLGWAFFRDTPLLQWPIGANPKLGLDFASSIVFTDSIPLAAFVFKPLNVVLPETFQYLGVWIWMCFVLQAYFGVRLLARRVADRSLCGLGAALIVLAPVLSYRLVHQGYGHIALVSHFVILAALDLYLDERGSVRKWAILICCALLIQAYFVPMVVAIWIASMVSRRLAIRDIARQVAIVLGSLGIVAVVSGFASLGGRLFVGDSSVTPEDFPYRFRWQPMALIDSATDFSTGWSHVMADQLELFGDVEGFTYLGSGLLLVVLPAVVLSLLRKRSGTVSTRDVVVVLGIVAACALVVPSRIFSTGIAVMLFVVVAVIAGRSIRERRHRALLVAAVLLGVYSMTMRPGVGRRTFFEYDLVPVLEQFTQTFRTHARSSWVLYYVVLLALVVLVATRLPRRLAIGVFALAVVVSVVDSNPAMSQVRHRFTSQPVWVNQLDDPMWDEVVQGRDAIITYPPLNNDLEGRWIHIEDFVQRRGMATNAGYFSRWSIDTYVRVNQRLHDELRAGEFDPKSLYVIFDPDMWAFLSSDPTRFAFIGDIDGYLVVAP